MGLKAPKTLSGIEIGATDINQKPLSDWLKAPKTLSGIEIETVYKRKDVEQLKAKST